jgi:serine/threonine-protein kinase
MEETVEPTLHSSKDAPPPVPRSNDLTGRKLGDFELIRRLGQGGMGQVYLARQLSLKRQVAVKILRTDLTANVTALRRFQLEAEAVARINHANIVQVYAIGETDGLNYMALEYVEGKNLREYLTKKGPPDLNIAFNIMRQVAAALQRAHEMGFVHRDIKPENILLTRKVEVKVADFGLSRCLGDPQPIHLTQSGVTMGTPLYMSPEQVQGKQVDHRSDIYSFGVTCYHMLAGEPPFSGETPFEVALQHVQNEPKPLKEFGIPDDLAGMVHKMMAKKADERFQSAKEILRDLTRLREVMALTQGGAALQTGSMPKSIFSTRSVAVPFAEESPEPAAAPKRKVPWLIVGILAVVGLAVGFIVHWQTHRAVAATGPVLGSDSFSGNDNPVETEQASSPARVKERELRHLIDDAATKGDAGLRGLLELTQLYIQEKRFKDAEALFGEQLQSRPFIKDIQKNAAKGGEQYPVHIGHMGMGIVYAYENLADKSLVEFGHVLPKTEGLPKTPRFIDTFLKRHMEWAKAIADALDRDARNMGGKLDKPYSRYRNYNSKG